MPFDLKCLLNVVPLQFYRNGLSLWKSLDENSSWFVSKMLFMKMRNKVLLEKFKERVKLPLHRKKITTAVNKKRLHFTTLFFFRIPATKRVILLPKTRGHFEYLHPKCARKNKHGISIGFLPWRRKSVLLTNSIEQSSECIYVHSMFAIKNRDSWPE